MARAGSPVPKIDWPATRISAPAAHDAGRVGQIYAAIHFDGRLVAGCIEQLAYRPNLRLASRDESLAPEPGIDRHHQHVVDIGRHLLDRDHRRRRVEDDARLRAETLDQLQRAMQVRQHLHVDRDHRRPGIPRTSGYSGPGPRS